jgi:DNA-binding NtrC family response regulator
MDLSEGDDAGKDLPFHQSIEHHKREIIRRALALAGGSQTRAAELLGLQRTYLARLIKQMEIK